MSVHDASQRSLFPAIAVPRMAKRRLSPGPNLAHHDLIMTPPELARRIVDYYAPRGRLLDPCRGAGAFYNAMLPYSDDVRWCEVAEGRNFLTYREPVDWIITNPPWSKFRPFLRHAMELAPNVVFLATITHFVTKARLREMASAGFGVTCFMLVDQPPSPWPGSGFQLAAVLMQRGAGSVFHRLPAQLAEVSYA
jgi:hypothetical protein